MQAVLQHREATLVAWIQATGTRGHHLACASKRSSTVICPGNSPKADHELRLKPDHPMGSGHSLSVPLAWLAARNITISRRIAYPLGRFAIMGSRSIHETIWTILFVTVLGFGMLTGTLALTVFCVGFAGKLFSDELEAIDMGP